MIKIEEDHYAIKPCSKINKIYLKNALKNKYKSKDKDKGIFIDKYV